MFGLWLLGRTGPHTELLYPCGSICSYVFYNNLLIYNIVNDVRTTFVILAIFKTEVTKLFTKGRNSNDINMKRFIDINYSSKLNLTPLLIIDYEILVQ